MDFYIHKLGQYPAWVPNCIHAQRRMSRLYRSHTQMSNRPRLLPLCLIALWYVGKHYHPYIASQQGVQIDLSFIKVPTNGVHAYTLEFGRGIARLEAIEQPNHLDVIWRESTDGNGHFCWTTTATTNITSLVETRSMVTPPVSCGVGVNVRVKVGDGVAVSVKVGVGVESAGSLARGVGVSVMESGWARITVVCDGSLQASAESCARTSIMFSLG